MYDFLQKPKRRHVKEIPLAPILDLLTVVIFFLILSTSFQELRQNLIPPNANLSTTDKDAGTDNDKVSPKLYVFEHESNFKVILKWSGKNPSEKVIIIEKNNNENLQKKITSLIKEFKNIYPMETNIQIAWEGKIKYQIVLNIVDSILPEIKDIVFLPPEELNNLSLKDKNEV